MTGRTLFKALWPVLRRGRGSVQFGTDLSPYGIEPNRRTLEELIASARDQGILSRAPAIEDLFARGTRDLVG